MIKDTRVPLDRRKYKPHVNQETVKLQPQCIDRLDV